MCKTALGIELGSTRIKAVAIDEKHIPVSSGDYTWKSTYENGIWTYDLAEVWTGLKTALIGVENRESVRAMGISGMMHGYLAFDKDWNLLVPFRTWQNTITGQAAKELTDLFGFNIPQRWSIAHLYQAILNGGDVKAVQGDSGHAQVKMVTDVYSHILDDDGRNNARLFEEAFYSGAGKDPTKAEPEPQPEAAPTADVSADTATLLKLLQNPEMAALLKTLAKSL